MGEFERERAKRLMAATMSSRLGTAFATEYRHIGDGPIDDFWYQWAVAIERGFVDALANAIDLKSILAAPKVH